SSPRTVPASRTSNWRRRTSAAPAVSRSGSTAKDRSATWRSGVFGIDASEDNDSGPAVVDDGLRRRVGDDLVPGLEHALRPADVVEHHHPAAHSGSDHLEVAERGVVVVVPVDERHAQPVDAIEHGRKGLVEVSLDHVDIVDAELSQVRPSLFESGEALLYGDHPSAATVPNACRQVGGGDAEVRPQFQHRVGPEGPGEVEEEPTLLGGGARFCRRPETGAVAGAVGYVEQSLERPGIVEETQSDLVDPPEILGGSPEALVDEVREGVPQESLGLAFGRRLPKPSSGGVFERRPARGAHLNLLYTSSSFCFSSPQLYRCLAWRQAAR